MIWMLNLKWFYCSVLLVYTWFLVLWVTLPVDNRFLSPLSSSRLCNGLSGTSRPPGACVPLSCVRPLFPLLHSWGGCNFPPGQRSLRGQDCQDLPRGEHDGHHAWLSGGGQWQSGPGPGTWCSEPTPTATKPGQYLCLSILQCYTLFLIISVYPATPPSARSVFFFCF